MLIRNRPFAPAGANCRCEPLNTPKKRAARNWTFATYCTAAQLTGTSFVKGARLRVSTRARHSANAVQKLCSSSSLSSSAPDTRVCLKVVVDPSVLRCTSCCWCRHMIIATSRGCMRSMQHMHTGLQRRKLPCQVEDAVPRPAVAAPQAQLFCACRTRAARCQ